MEIKDWPDPWIRAAKAEVERYYEEHYHVAGPQDPSCRNNVATPTISDPKSDRRKNWRNLRTVIDDTSHTSPLSSCYTDFGPHRTGRVLDVVQFWQKSDEPESLKRFALDILTVPDSSVDVERAFSLSGLVLRPRRLCLNEDSVNSVMTMNSWIDTGLVSYDNFESDFGHRIRRTLRTRAERQANGNAKRDKLQI